MVESSSQAEASLQKAILSDPLSEETRKERRYLLIASSLGIFMVKTGFIPTKITALGIEFSETDRNSFLNVIAVIIIYFLIAFIFYSLADYWSYKINVYLTQLRSMLNKYDSLVNLQRGDLKDIKTEVQEIVARRDLIQKEISEAVLFENERAEEAEGKFQNLKEKVQNLKILAASDSIKVGEERDKVEEEKENLLNQNNQSMKELTSEISEFEGKGKVIKRELDMKKNRLDILGLRANLDENKLFVPTAKVVAFFRLVFEYLIPVCISIYAIFLLFNQTYVLIK